MKDWLYRHRFGVSVVVLMVLPLMLMYLHGRRGHGTTLVERMAMSLAGASQSAITSLVGWSGDLIQNYLYLVDVQESNLSLAQENERLLGEALAAKRLAIENQSLRKLVGLKTQLKKLNKVPARVVGRELTPYYRVSRMSVEAGEGFEARKDMAVVTHEGLVGRVVKVAAGYADVMILSDSRSRVACEVLGRGVLGMVLGNGLQEGFQVRLQVAVSEKLLEEGAVVQTSGHDQVFPRGIEVGYVAEPWNVRQKGPYNEYDVILAVNPTTVEHAMVVEAARPDRE
ncbi:MAG: rod shape-determining protein MreC [Deltaproteobacteria bacterium]|nr:rod shape-determining protein MreC [Deltaproteobacteria bacterium]